METPWRNGSASDSRSEGCVFKSRRGHKFSLEYQYPKEASVVEMGVAQPDNTSHRGKIECCVYT